MYLKRSYPGLKSHDHDRNLPIQYDNATKTMLLVFSLHLWPIYIVYMHAYVHSSFEFKWLLKPEAGSQIDLKTWTSSTSEHAACESNTIKFATCEFCTWNWFKNRPITGCSVKTNLNINFEIFSTISNDAHWLLVPRITDDRHLLLGTAKLASKSGHQFNCATLLVNYRRHCYRIYYNFIELKAPGLSIFTWKW
jgi:hypothetical protein